MAMSATSSIPPNYSQLAGSIGTVPVPNSTNAGGPTPPPPPPAGQGNQTPPAQVSSSTSTNLVDKTA
jgi:hypothetical protein